MRNWFKNKVRKWYLKYCDADVVEMTRLQMHAVGVSIVWDNMSSDDQKVLIDNASALLENRAFNIIVDEVMNSQKDYAMNYSTDWEQVKFSRGQISGASLVRELAERYASMREGEKENYNRFDPI